MVFISLAGLVVKESKHLKVFMAMYTFPKTCKLK